ncbi:DinB family protein [Nocardioides maradonensis]
MADMWTDSENDPRTSDNPKGELATYREYLTNYRLTLAMKCEELSPEQLATRSVPPSSMSLLGMIRHMAKVENSWFQRALQGNLDQPRLFDPERRDLDWDEAVGTKECVEEAIEVWEREIGKADAYLDTLTDDRLGDEVVYNADGQTASIRDIVVHMIEEYARHCGHADLLRECIDGRVGQ